MSNQKLLHLVGSIESKSTHPIGKAFTDYLKDNNLVTLQVKEFGNVSGFGIIGRIDEQKIYYRKF